MKKVKENLNQINFNKLLILEESVDLEKYGFLEYERNNLQHNIKGFCTKCELDGVNKSIKEESDFELKNISHGSHSLDFLNSLENMPDISGWKEEGIMFIMEAPSLDYEIYETREYNNIIKRPSKDWYWIHNRKNIKGFPEYFTGRTYGTLITSIILTFKLKNAYLTNLVKCGMNNEGGTKYEGIASFNKESIHNCFDEMLSKEIEIISPKIIFTFGSSTYNNLWHLLKNSKFEYLIENLVSLPHPAGSRRGFKNIYYQVIYFNLILKGFVNRDIVSESESHELIDLYINKGFD